MKSYLLSLPGRLLQVIRSRMLYKMLIVYSLLTLVPLIVVSTTFFARTGKLIERKATEEMQQNLAEKGNAIDDKLQQIKKRMLEMQAFNPLQELLKADANPDVGIAQEEEQAQLENTVVNWLSIELTEMQQRFGDYFDNYYVLTLSDKLYGTEKEVGLIHLKAYPLLPFEFRHVPEWAFFTDNDRLACVMNIFETSEEGTTSNLLGMLIVTLNPDKVTSLYEEYEEERFLITNSNNLVVSSVDRSQIGKVLDNRNNDLIVLKQKSRASDFVYIDLFHSTTGSVVRNQIEFASLITLLAWAIVFIVTYVFLRKVTIPIQRLTRLMRKVEQEQYFPIEEITSSDEVAILCHGYNQMIRRTKELIDTNYKNELLKQEAELKAIRMHINPHFLYNTLEYASIMSQSAERARLVPDILHKLSAIFRFSIHPGSMFVSLETELGFAETYLDIHRYRYGERLRYEVTLPGMLRNAAVPKLILQPLIENAVIHGIDRLEDGGIIRIRAEERDFQMLIEIENSSLGEEEQASFSRRTNKPPGLGSGLDNVNSRLRHHYGGNYGVTLQRGTGSTTVRLTMPIQLVEKEN
jgi:Predicted signal transduction protein with a C-terminal ATPase domain